MRYRVIYFQCLCYLALPLCIVSIHLTRCVSFFFLRFSNSLFLKLQFMRIKMYILTPTGELDRTIRARRRAAMRLVPNYFVHSLVSYAACSCNVFGSERSDCEQTSGQCVCKHHVTGRKCDTCYNGRHIGPLGCAGIYAKHLSHHVRNL